MKTLKIFSMAALALVMAACSSEDNEIQQPAQKQQGPMKFTATLAAPNSGASTRTTATADGDNFNVAWKVGDDIALIYEVSSTRYLDKATVTAVDASGNATISGILSTSVTSGTAVNLVYPYDVVNQYWGQEEDTYGTGKGYTPEPYYFYNQAGVTPTDETNGIPKYDWRDGVGTFGVDGNSVTLSDNVVMAPNVAIWKLTLQDESTPTPNSIQAKELLFMDPYFRYSISTSATNVIYLYLPIPYLPISSSEIVVVDENGDEYSYTITNVLSLTAGKIYASTVTLKKMYTIDFSDGYIFSYSGDDQSWQDAINNHPAMNYAWSIENGHVRDRTGFLMNADGNAYIDPSSAIDPSETYKFLLNQYPCYPAEIYYIDGETWNDAITKHSTENAGWSIDGSAVKYNGQTLCKDGNEVDATDTIPSWGDFSFK